VQKFLKNYLSLFDKDFEINATFLNNGDVRKCLEMQANHAGE
jgi:hypothetical protein